MFDNTEYKIAFQAVVDRFQQELKKFALVALTQTCSPALKSKLMVNTCHLIK